MTTVEREAATSPEGAVEDSRPDRAESRYGPYVRRLLLAALVITSTVKAGRQLLVDARAPALLVAAVLLWIRAPFVVVVLAAAATAAAVRALL